MRPGNSHFPTHFLCIVLGALLCKQYSYLIICDMKRTREIGCSSLLFER